MRPCAESNSDSGLPAAATSSGRGTRRPPARATSSTSSSRLWITLWLVEVTPTRLPADQVDDQARAGVRLARPRRALDEEVAAVEAGDDLLALLQLHPRVVDRRAGLAAAQAGRVAAEDAASGAVGAAGPAPSLPAAAAARRRRAPPAGAPCRRGRREISAAGSGSAGEPRARASAPAGPPSASIERISPARLRQPGHRPSSPRRSWSPARGTKRVAGGSSSPGCGGDCRHRARPPIASASSISSLRLDVEAVEEGPPHRPRLAVVVLEQLRHQPARPLLVVAPARSSGSTLEQSLAQRARSPRGSSSCVLGCAPALGSNLSIQPALARPNSASASARSPQQPVAQLQGRDAVVLVVVGDPVEDRVWLAGPRATLELDDRVAAVGHVGLALPPCRRPRPS